MADPPQVVYVTHAPPPYTIQPNITMTRTVILNTPVGPDPVITTCPSCEHQIVTRTETRPTTRTHLCACILFCFICWPCVCLPYCMNSCNDVDHYCPSCNAYIGGYKH